MRPLDPNLLLRAYSAGIFPMADSRTAGSVYWVEPEMRGILPLDGFRLSRSLAKTLRSDRLSVTADRAFGRVVAACAESTPERPATWINAQIEAACAELHLRGHAHSIECWEGEALVGGLYGVSLGGAFFGESMFSRRRDASKVALAHLVVRLREGGFRLLDCQFITDHLASLGAIEIPRDDYVSLLDWALAAGDGADFGALDRLDAPRVPGAGSAVVPAPISGCVIAQSLAQTS